ncbi:MAG TPA: metal-dependent hydrolase [bacterium]|nr:metal-dependent hydrolase [bacterium]
MPLTKLHTMVGAVTGAAYYTIDRKISDSEFDPEKAAACFMLGGLAGSLPDILEPPLHRKHRSFFHSFTTLGAAVYAFNRIDSIDDIGDEDKTILKSMLSAYLTHLLLDSRTPAGLPLLI